MPQSQQQGPESPARMSSSFTSATSTAESDRPQQYREGRLTFRNRTRKRPTTKLAICSYNARTIRTQVDLEMILNSLQSIKYDVIALQETKRNPEYHQKLEDGTEILLGARDPVRPVGGIGFIVAPHMVPFIEWAHTRQRARRATISMRSFSKNSDS